MTPLTFMPTAPPSRPVSPAGGGAADTSSSPSFESALQRAGASDNSQPGDARAVTRHASGKPAARSTAPVTRAQDDKRVARDAEGVSDGDAATTATSTRTRDGSTRDAASGKRESKSSPKDSPGDAPLAPAVVSVPVQTAVPVAATLPVESPAMTAGITDGKLALLAGTTVSAPQTSGTRPVTPQGAVKAADQSKSPTANPGSVFKPSFESEGPVDDSAEEIDLPEARSAPMRQPAAPSTDVPHAQPQRASVQAARTLLADALQRAGTPQGPQAQAPADARPAPSTAPEAAVTAATMVKSAGGQAEAASEPAPQAKVTAKAHAQAPSVQDATAQATGSSQHEGASAGNGGTSTGSGRREGAPLPQPKSDAAVSWPNAFAIRVPEAMTSSLERTGSAGAVLPPAVTVSDLANLGPQLVRGLQLQARDGGGDMKMTLTPEHLGSVTIEVQVRHDRVSATLTAETPEVRQWIATHQADLKNSLASVGLSLEDLVVKDEGGGGGQESRGDEQPSQPERRQPAPEQDEAQFEVVV